MALTLARVAAVPALVAVHSLQAAWAPGVCFLLFVAASVTDWLDGYLARKLEATSAFGAFLDPVADKLMVAAALVLLASRPPAALAVSGPTSGVLLTIPSVAIISREITMSAFREWAAAAGEAARSAVAVNSLGKWKTAAQMTALALLLAADCAATSPVLLGASRGAVAATGAALLWLSAALAWVSLGAYMQAALPALLRK